MAAILFTFASPMIAQAQFTGTGNIECKCEIHIIPEVGSPVHATTTIRGDSIASIDGGLCQEYRIRTVDALEASGVRVRDALHEVSASLCNDLSIVDSASSSESGGSAASITLYNPLGADIGVAEFISRGLRTVIGFVGALALLMFVYGGVMWMTAGDSKRIDTAKEILKNSTIGLLLIFFSYSIVSVVFSLLGGT